MTFVNRLLFCGFVLSALKFGALKTQETCNAPGNVQGECIPVKECKPMVDFLSNTVKPIPQNIVHQLVLYSCGYKNNTALVCCPPNPISFQGTEEESSVLDELANHRNIGLIPADCGMIETEDRIRNGENAQLKEFPWMAVLSYKTPRGVQFNCGGTVINERYILTAAHCIVATPNPLVGVRIGEYDLSTETDCQDDLCLPPVQDLKIEKIVPHPEYNTTLYSNDIGLIRVSKIHLTAENSKTVCLPIREDVRSRNFSSGIVAGWGFTNQYGRKATILQKALLPIHNLSTCAKAYEKLPQVTFTNKQLCAGGIDNRDSCGGDSGGPLHSAVYFDEENRYVQRGIVSIGHAHCGLSGYPSVFTNVASYLRWILDTIEP